MYEKQNNRLTFNGKIKSVWNDHKKIGFIRQNTNKEMNIEEGFIFFYLHDSNSEKVFECIEKYTGKEIKILSE